MAQVLGLKFIPFRMSIERSNLVPSTKTIFITHKTQITQCFRVIFCIDLIECHETRQPPIISMKMYMLYVYFGVCNTNVC
jgi:hypothetical protein